MPLLFLPLTIEFSCVAMLTDQIIPCVAQSTTPTTKHMYNQMRVQIYNVRQNLKTLTSLTRLRYQHHGLFLNVKTRCERITVERNLFLPTKGFINAVEQLVALPTNYFNARLGRPIYRCISYIIMTFNEFSRIYENIRIPCFDLASSKGIMNNRQTVQCFKLTVQQV